MSGLVSENAAAKKEKNNKIMQNIIQHKLQYRRDSTQKATRQNDTKHVKCNA